MKPLSPMDLTFLFAERRNQPMHVGGLQLITPPPDAPPDFVQRIAERIRNPAVVVAPFNQRLVRRFGAWFWTEDTDFDLEAHVRVLALARPGRIRELLALVSQLHSNHLDRARPLWEYYIIDGVENGRVAVYVKIHHALVDGVAAMRMLMKSMSENPLARQLPPIWAKPLHDSVDAGGEARAARPSPAAVLAQLAQAAREQIGGLPLVLRELYRTAQEARSSGALANSFLAPRSILNQRISASRRFAAQSYSLDRIRTVGKLRAATVNDVVLAMCASALRKYLLELDALPDQSLVAMVPISMRRDDTATGNQVAMLLARLGTQLSDPLERLQTIQRSVQASKDRYAKMTPAQILSYAGMLTAPSNISVATGFAPHFQAYNLTISNVPGPKKPLYWNGARMEGTYPVSIVADGQAMNITLNSYADKMEFGITACRRALPHIQRLLDYLEQGLGELEAAA
ncbi:MAG: WS/DGAT/MGAT family O-acyltransferase [Burkholderiales bacterium]